MLSQLTFPNTVLFGAGALSAVPSELAKLGCARPLVVTDPGLVDCGLAQQVVDLVSPHGIEPTVFSDVAPNPTEEHVENGHRSYASHGCDGVIGLGGGSALDTAKAIRLKVNHRLPLAAYSINARGWEKMTEPVPPMVAIATTAGTGSEVARGALILVRPDHAKVAIVGPALYSSVVIADPVLTVSLPPHLTAGTGMDAFTHCVEEVLSPRYNPIVDGLALEGIRLCARSLRRAVESGDDIEARSDMMMAAMMGGMGFMKGLGIVHSLSHPVGSVAGGHHGTTNAIFLAACLEFNFRAAPTKYRSLARAVGIAADSLDDEACKNELVRFVVDLNAELGIPNDLSVFGAKREHVERMIPMCLEDHCHKTNPRVCTEADFRTLLLAHIPE